jgi:hypothetical protein
MVGGFGRRATFGGVARENIGPDQNQDSYLDTLPRSKCPEKGLTQIAHQSGHSSVSG